VAKIRAAVPGLEIRSEGILRMPVE
jgi:hypothetical protein